MAVYSASLSQGPSAWLWLIYEHLVCALFLASYGNAANVLATHAGKISLTGTSGLGSGLIRRRIW